MAVQSIATTVLAQNYAGDVVRTVNRTCSALRVLPIRMDEGKNCAWVAEKDGATAQAMLEGANPAAATSDGQDSAVLNWAYYEQSSSVTGPAQAAARTSRTPQGNLNQIARQVTNSLAALVSKVNLHVYSGDGAASPKQVTGLDQAIGDNTNTYATIARGSVATWKPYLVNPGVATNLSLGQIREDLKEITVQSGMAPDIALCHHSVFNEVGNLFDSQRRLIQTVTEFTTARGKIVLSGGYSGIEVDGCVFIKDKDATLESGSGSGRIYYVNSEFVSLQILPPPEFAAAFPQLMFDPETVLTANDGFGDIPLMAAVVKLAKTGDATPYMAKTYCELRVKNPRTCGVRRFVKLNFAP
jgi:hypothetical protein